MKLSQLAAKPQLIKILLDEPSFIEEYGECLEFFTWDRQPLVTFMKLANANHQDTGAMIDIVKTLILDEDAKPIIKEDLMLPTKLLMAVIQKVVETLGK
jgi:hypothetical protein